MKRALITGALGQDGLFLSEFLRAKGYTVFGLVRRMIKEAGPIPRVHYLYGDLRDELSLETAIRKCWPDEIYNLAGQVFVPTSWCYPEATFDVNTGGLARILKILELTKPETKVYQASSSEMFGNYNGRCDENTPLAPMSPYGVSKAAAHRLCALYRERGMFVVSGMLFNHESERRGPEMVTRKIAKIVALWAAGVDSPLHLGNVHAKRDWGFAGDYVKAMWMMMQRERAEDWVIGTGESYSVEAFLSAACKAAGTELKDLHCDSSMVRAQEIWDLRADASKANMELHWWPETSFEQLVERMVKSEMKELEKAFGAVA